MTPAEDHRILTINSGSSSLKIAQFLVGKKETLDLSARIERIAVGHRVVQGGLHYDRPELITPQMEKALAKLEPLDLDPGVMLNLLREKSLSSSPLSDLVNKRAGLVGCRGEICISIGVPGIQSAERWSDDDAETHRRAEPRHPTTALFFGRQVGDISR